MKNIKFLLLLLSFSLTYFNIYSQPVIQWQKSLGGTDFDHAYSIYQTFDGGYIVAGSSRSNDGDVTENHGGWVTIAG